MRPLGELEAVVMGRLWNRDKPASVREVVESLRGQRDLAYTTVMTVMDNLHRKEMVTRQMQGRAYLYSPALSQAEYSAELIATAVEGADRAEALLQFIGELSPKEVARIRKALDDSAKDSSRIRRLTGRTKT